MMEQRGLKIMNSKWTVIFTYLTCLIGVLIFAKGFFPTKSSLIGSGAVHPNAPRDAATLDRLLAEDFVNVRGKVLEEEVINSDGIPAPYQKLVLVVVDAMRADFITSPQYAKHMPFLDRIIDSGHGVMYTAKAKPPTVTMPRLKALCTGSVPGYIDVLLNMDQALELKEDNIISRFLTADKDIIFFGDNVWLKLFPHSFIRHDGTTAFFVADYTEVDFNVTRHLNRELRERSDWDVMILHYLGMDHIGHLAGPTSPLMPPKLAEMDSVLSTIYSGVKDKENVMIVVTSDHGMSEQGSHGGTTKHEVDTPLVFITPSEKLRSEDDEVEALVEQTDFASTLAVLFGLRIPSGSMGHVIPSMLNVMNREEHLYSLQYNCHHLLTLTATSVGLDSFALTATNPLVAYRHGLTFHNEFLDGKRKGDSEWFHSARTNYITCMTALSDKLTSKLASYDYGLMALGSIILIIGFCGILFLWFGSLLRNRHIIASKSESSKNLTRILIVELLGCLLYSATLPGSSFVEEEHQIWHFLTISIAIAIFVAFLRTIAQTEKAPSPDVASSSLLYDARLFGGNAVLRQRKDALKTETWELLPNDEDLLNQNNIPQNGFANEMISIDDDQDRSVIKKRHVKHVIVGLSALFVHRALRSWNQTGIKHAADPDIGDWFNTPENKPALSVLSFTGLTVICLLIELLCSTRDIIRTGMVACGLCAVYWYRLAVSLVALPGYKFSKSLGLLPAWITYSCVGLLVAKAMYHRFISFTYDREHPTKSRCSRLCICLTMSSNGTRCLDCFQSAVVLLSALLVRPHNHCALAFNLFLYLSMFRLIWPVVIEQRFNILEKELRQLTSGQPNEAISSTEALGRVVLSYWFGQMSYFTMGNSNSFATVDLSAAYIGLSGSAGWYNYAFAGFLGVFSTYLGPILWIIMCTADIMKAKYAFVDNYKSQDSSSKAITCTLSAIRLFSLAVYVAVATGHRYHLFIWSVFSPKLLYEIANTIVHFFLLIIITLLW